MSDFKDRYKEIQQEIYSYQGIQVKVITVFNESTNCTAIVEDENGEQFEVFKDQLY